MQSPASSSSCAAILLLMLAICLFASGGAVLKGNKTKIKTSRGNKQTERKKERKKDPSSA